MMKEENRRSFLLSRMYQTFFDACFEQQAFLQQLSSAKEELYLAGLGEGILQNWKTILPLSVQEEYRLWLQNEIQSLQQIKKEISS